MKKERKRKKRGLFCRIGRGIRLADRLLMTGSFLYLGSIYPGGKKKRKPLPKRYYAHRGLHDNQSEAPENTLAAFGKAVAYGYGMELDVQLTKDGQVVVAHDYDLKRICGVEGQIDEFTYEELQQYPILESQERIPLLKDVLRLVDGKAPLIVEIKLKNKNSRICEKAQEILDSYQGEYCVESFHPLALLWYKKNRPDLCRGQLSTNYQLHTEYKGLVYFLLRHLMTNFATFPDFIAYDCRDYQALSLKLCRNLFGCQAVAWTVTGKAQLEEIRDYYDVFIFEGFLP